MQSSGFNPFSREYRNVFGNSYIRQFEVYDNYQERIGQVVDVRINDAGHFQYLVVDLVAPGNKRVLVPLSQTQIDQQRRRIYIQELSKAQVMNLPPYNPAAISQSSQPLNSSPPGMPLEASIPLETAMPLETSRSSASTAAVPTVSQTALTPADTQSYIPSSVYSNAYSDDRVNQPLQHSQPDQGTTIRLHEERLVVDRGKRRKVGEVIVRKEIETRTVEVPIRREKLIVERISPDYQQLAVVDLPVEQADFGVAAIDPVPAQPSVNGEFTSAEAASRFLDAIAHHPSTEYQTIQIKITLRDAAEQAIYQEWLERYRG